MGFFSSLTIKERQIKKKNFEALSYPSQCLRLRKPLTTKSGERARETILHCWVECKLVQSLWKSVWRILETTTKSTLRPSYTMPWHVSKGLNILLHRYLLSNDIASLFPIAGDGNNLNVFQVLNVYANVAHAQNGIIFSVKELKSWNF